MVSAPQIAQLSRNFSFPEIAQLFKKLARKSYLGLADAFWLFVWLVLNRVVLRRFGAQDDAPNFINSINLRETRGTISPPVSSFS